MSPSRRIYRPGPFQATCNCVSCITGAIEEAASQGGFDIEVPFIPGRADASQDQTDESSFSVLEPSADGFKNYFGDNNQRSPAEMLVEKAALLNLTAPEMAVLVAGMRALNANTDSSSHGVLTSSPGVLDNSFFVNLVDMSIRWAPSSEEGVYEGRERGSDALIYTATPVDLATNTHYLAWNSVLTIHP